MKALLIPTTFLLMVMAAVSLEIQAQGGAGPDRASGAGGGTQETPKVGLPVPLVGATEVRSLDSDPALGASYPRVIQIAHYTPAKGQLLATFSRRGAMPIYRSTDNGDTWQF